MNGATVEPWVRTISPPISTIMRRMGSSQNFFLTRMKAHNSDKNDILAPKTGWTKIGDPAREGRAVSSNFYHRA